MLMFKYILLLSIIFFAGCATVISSNPNLGHINNYDFQVRFLDKNIEIATNIPIDLAKNNSTRLGKHGLFILNLKVINLGADYYLLNREDIELVLDTGIRYQTLSIEKVLDISFGTVGLYRFLFLPDIAEEYNLYGLGNISLLSPGSKKKSELSKYVFFQIEDSSIDLSGSELIVPLMSISRSNKINYSVGFRNEDN